MWKPETQPARGLGAFDPLSADLCPGYNALRAEHSVLRQEVKRRINAKMTGGFTNQAEVLVVTDNPTDN